MDLHVVTGGAGFLGSNLCRRLLADGHEVIAIDTLVAGSIKNIQDLVRRDRFTFVRDDAVHIKQIVGRQRPTHVWALAALASPVAYFGRPLETAWAATEAHRATLEAAADWAARILYTSTSEVYGDPEVHPQTEDYRGSVDPLSPRSCYDEGKRYGETLCRIFRDQTGVDVRIVRLFNIYGPGMAIDDGRMIPAFVAAAARGGPMQVHGSGMQTRSLCYVSDLIAGLIRVMNAPAEAFAELPHGGLPVLNLGNPDERTVLDVARITWQTVHELRPDLPADPQIVFAGGYPDDPKRRCPDVSRACRLIGWAPLTSLEQGIWPTVRWLLGVAHDG